MSSVSAVTAILDLVVLDCPDTMALARFYASLLGYELQEGSDADWATIAHPEGGVSRGNPGGRVSIGFQHVDEYVRPTWPTGAHPQQFHLDLSVPDIAAAESHILALGAAVAEVQPSETGSFRVYLDPAGHPFCLVRA